MKKIILFSILLFSTSIIFAQNWQGYYMDETLKIEYALIDYKSQTDGIHHQRVIFKYTNLTDKDIEVTFNRFLFYGKKCFGCHDEVKKVFTVNIKANSSLEYNDRLKNDKTFYIFSKDFQGFIKDNLSEFEIFNIKYN